MLTDYHIHTEFSDDSSYPLTDMVEDAIRLGLDEICTTEHVDYGVKQYTVSPYEEYWQAFSRCREQYKDQIDMKFGIEFGVQRHTIAQYQKDILAYPFDFIICSCHQVDDLEFWNQDFQKGKTQQEYNEKYYEEILAVVQRFKDYSVLGHLDMIRRYDNAGDYPYARTKPIIAEILKQVIRDGKGIEVNTSCFRYGLNDLTPSVQILELYRDLGGEILTIGSDTHEASHLGYQIPAVRQQLKGLGYTVFHTFREMKPNAYML